MTVAHFAECGGKQRAICPGSVLGLIEGELGFGDGNFGEAHIEARFQAARGQRLHLAERQLLHLHAGLRHLQDGIGTENVVVRLVDLQ
jgi:hypothetical protein